MPPPNKRRPSKLDTLRKAGAIHPHPQSVTDPLFHQQPFFDAHDLMQVKYEMLRRVDIDGASVSAAAASFGLSRPSFYQARSALEQGGLAGLAPRKHGPRRAHKFTAEVLEFLGKLRAEQPEIRYQQMAQRLKQQFAIAVNPRSIERHLRHAQKKTS